MARGGYRVGSGGRKAGELSVEDEVAQREHKEMTPLEYMLAVMNDPNAEESRRDRMSIAAAPFVHPRAGEVGKKEKKAEAAHEAAQGRFRPAEPPRLVHSK